MGVTGGVVILQLLHLITQGLLNITSGGPVQLKLIWCLLAEESYEKTLGSCLLHRAWQGVLK